jgi:hypothetical protein
MNHLNDDYGGRRNDAQCRLQLALPSSLITSPTTVLREERSARKTAAGERMVVQVDDGGQGARKKCQRWIRTQNRILNGIPMILM